MSKLKTKEAMQLVFHYYSENGYSKASKSNAEKMLSKLDKLLSLGICKDMEEIEIFILQQNLSYNAGCEMRHFAYMVFCAMETGSFSNSNVKKPKPSYIKSIEYISELECYISLLNKQGRAPSTVGFEMWANRELLIYLESIGITRFADILPVHLINYQKLKISSYSQSTGKAVVYRIRHFIKYLILEEKINPLLLSCMESKLMQKESVPTILTEEQRLILMNLPKAITAKEARDKAIILCALRLGLRKSDIYKLKLAEIDWTEQRISLVQKKTHIALVLPLPKDVGNAIADYILHFRAKSSSLPFVFLSVYGPYKSITGDDLIKQKFIDPPLITGYHILRRTCATYLLNQGVGALTIMNILGQQNLSSMDCYLSLDSSQMLQTSLRLGVIGLPEVLV
jgi:site-specific recombinase XerD